MTLSRYLSLEVLFIHVGHGILGIGAVAVVAANIPWWASLMLTPLVLFSILFWIYEASFVIPAATRLWRGKR